MNGYPGLPVNPTRYGVRPSQALVQQLLVGAFGWMFAGLLLTAAVAYLVGTTPAVTSVAATLFLPVIIVQLIVVFAIQGLINRASATLSLGLFFVYAASMGITLGLILGFYQPSSIVAAGASTAAMFGGASLYGAVTKRDLSGMGGLLVMALIGLIVAMVVNMFLASSGLTFLISIVGVLLFTGLTAWDVQRITSGQYAAIASSAERASILAALHLYLDAVNLFLFLLRLFGSGRR